MKQKKKKTKDPVLTAFRRGSRELEFERNGGGQWVAIDRPWKNKKAYSRKASKESLRKDILGDSSFSGDPSDSYIW